MSKGFAADEVLYEDFVVRGVATKDAGIAKNGGCFFCFFNLVNFMNTGEFKDSFARGVALMAKQTLFAEGCRGSCSQEVIKKFQLDEDRDVQSYGLGIKEVWEVPEDKIKPGLIQHTVGWPLHESPFSKVYGGTFLYHMKPNLIQLGKTN